MTYIDFERTLSYHCAPVLMGIKPSNLVSFAKNQMTNASALMHVYGRKLEVDGICMEIICECTKRYMVFIYRPNLLREVLSRPEVRSFLVQAGYSPQANLKEDLAHLRSRYVTGKNFPHEIGVFLGYPLEDVEGFSKYHGCDYKLSGYWKVYGDEVKAAEMFRRMDRCRAFACDKMQEGYDLCQILAMKHLCA